jgi:hypothetical protein
MGHFKALDIENVNRLDHSMDGVLIAEVLIEFAISALIVMGAGSIVNASLHVVQTGLLPGRQFSQAVLPIDNFTPASGRGLTLLLQAPVFTRCAPQGPVQTAGFTMIVD